MKFISILAMLLAIFVLAACGEQKTETPVEAVKATATPTLKEQKRALKTEAATLVVDIGAMAGQYAGKPEKACANIDKFTEKNDRLTEIVDELTELDPNYDTESIDEMSDLVESAEDNCIIMKATAEEVEPVEEVEPSMTTAQENAIESAESYLDSSDFSKKGLIGQLEYEEFSKADAKFAVNHISVNWKQEAVESAKSYLDSSSFSRQSLLEQLLYEEFTSAQAEYAVSKVY